MALDIELIRSRRRQNQVHYFESIGSTMTEGARLAACGAPHGTVVLANEQTAGIGRLGRSWSSQAGLGIYSSTLLRLALSPANIPVASLLLGLATAAAIQEACNLACDLRWPNDVLINERKVAGILPHLVDGCVVAGIGINVNHLSFEENLRTPATSLRLESNGRLYAREELIVRLLESLDTFCEILATQGTEAILRAFTSASSYAWHRCVVLEEGGARGVTAGLDPSGFLMVRLPDGRVQRVASGGVRPDR